MTKALVEGILGVVTPDGKKYWGELHFSKKAKKDKGPFAIRVEGPEGENNFLLAWTRYDKESDSKKICIVRRPGDVPENTVLFRFGEEKPEEKDYEGSVKAVGVQFKSGESLLGWMGEFVSYEGFA